MTSRFLRTRHLVRPAALAAPLSLALAAASAAADTDFTPAGQRLTPTAAPGSTFELFNPGLLSYPNFRPSGGAATVLSPDQKTLVVVLAGYNDLTNPAGSFDPAASNEYIFVYDVSSGKPVKKQVIQLPNSFVGAAFSPDGETLYVGGGQDDDVHTYTRTGGAWVETGTAIPLGHRGTNSVVPTDVPPATAGLAVTADGTRVLVANLYNDSVSIVDPVARKVVGEVDLRPGKQNPAQKGVPGGEYPYGLAVKSNETAYLSSLRDREVVVVSLGAAPKVTARVKVHGSPNSALLSKDGRTLYVTADFEDVVNVIDTETNTLVKTIKTTGPDYVTTGVAKYKGSIPNNLALSPDERTLYVTDAGTNALAIIDLKAGKTTALVPTPFWPTAVAVSRDGSRLFVTNWKSPTGPNPHHASNAANQYVLQLQHAGLLTLAVPTEAGTPEQLTRTVAANNRLTAKPNPTDVKVMGALRGKIKHVIYIVKENRTYDQLLGDLGAGNGDPFIVQFGQKVTPNYHRIATDFVNLDNFYTPGDVSGNGWPWSTAARESDYGVKSITDNYAGRGFDYDTEGTNRDVNVAYPTLKERLAAAPYLTPDPDILPGTADVAAPDSAEDEEGRGYLWDAAVRKGLTIRDYGFFCDLVRYSSAVGPDQIPLERDPFSKKLQVAFPAKGVLLANFDPYFRSFDTAFPDFWREREWEREFAQFEANGKLPQLTFLRLMEDHMGSFDAALDGVDTPEKQQSDNDYAVARAIDRVAHSRYKNDTVFLICEDDSQDGSDHVDAHRSTAYVVGAYVKHHALVSTRYSTVNMIRTIEDILGLEHLNLYTATARPMADCFDPAQTDWTFTAKPSAFLVNGTTLPVPRDGTVSADEGVSTHDAQYWAEKTRGFDFSREDHLGNVDRFNRIIWEGLKGSAPYPTARSGEDLRQNRRELLERAGVLKPAGNGLPPATASQQ